MTDSEMLKDIDKNVQGDLEIADEKNEFFFTTLAGSTLSLKWCQSN